ncbi:hypothetical protein [Pseudoalteromonas spongiae]|uniref:hypothetical protein n=1 Tax=Pseudoalteromonas spongiae TaxID=298657 RepID=UPI000C2D0660|nr:hypothetical protein [Pseudoalteromonas spongiae]
MNITIMGSIALAVFAMIFLYVRGENFKRQARQLSSSLDGASRETKYLSEIVIELAKEEQKLLRERFIKVQRLGSPKVELLRFSGLLVEASESVISDSALGHKSVQQAFKHYVANYTPVAFEEFNSFILQQDTQIRQLWTKNNIHSYLDLCKACIEDLERAS